MHGTYISSTLLPHGTRGSLSFCFNDYSNLLNERFDGNPFAVSSSPCYSCCNCCCCCCASSSFATTHRWPANPILFGGLRQSALIQCSPTRRLVSGGRDRYYYRAPAYGLDQGTREFSSSFKSRSEKIETRGKGRVRRVNIHERGCLGGVDDVEAVISLLSEEVSEEYLGGRSRNGRLMRRAETEKRGSYGSQCRKGMKKNDGLNLVESDSKCESKSSRFDLRREEFRRKEGERQEREREERKAVSIGEHRRERKASSSLSSYYSLSSADDFESDKEAQDDYGESSTGLTDFRSGENRLGKEVVEESKSHRDGEQEESLKQSSATRTCIDWDLRKKSEKKLTDAGETQMTRIFYSDYSKAASSHKQFDNVKESALKDNQVRDRTSEQSEFSRNYQESTDRQQRISTNVESTSLYQQKFSGKKENLTVAADLVRERMDEPYKTVGKTTEKSSLCRNTAKSTVMSKIEDIRTEGVSDLRYSEPRMKIREEDTARRSVWKTGQQGHQVSELTAKTEPRRSRQQFSETSTTYASSLQSESRMKNHEESMAFASGSGTEAKEYRSYIDEKVQQGVQSREGSNAVTNLSVNLTNVSLIHGSNTETAINYHGTSEKRMNDLGGELTSDIDKTRRTGEIDDKVEKNVIRTGLRSEVLRGTNTPNFNEKTSQQISSSRESLNGMSEVKVQQIDLEDNLRSSEFTVMPPPSQSVAAGSLHVGSRGNTTKKVYGDTSESSSNASYMYSGERTPVSHEEPSVGDGKGVNYMEPLNLIVPEDALGSARRLEESSSQFVGEFVEKARHGMSTSVNQMQRTAYDAKLVHEGEEDERKSLTQYSSDKLKDQNPRGSSENSGTKGPSDEIWDVTEPSVSEHPETEAPEGSQEVNQEVKNVSGRRTGRSLWSIIANVVQLRWGSHAETPKSAERSGRKDSSPDSASSEAWFSGHEPEENTDENVKRGRKSSPIEATSSQQSELGEVQAEVSETTESKDKRRQDEAGTSSTSVIISSGPTLKGISSPPEEKTLAWRKDGMRVDSSMELGESSLPFPSSDRLLIDETPRTARADVSVSSSMELIGQPVNATVTEISGSKGASAELKRRKLQRTEQMTRDRFDEWEEAYKRDSEQKKIDEMFMKEALLEAKKAADTWEVPVGAVLVQHGKIIARGYNLVEELRDSTAHAEMICIREASRQLRTWRLAETTLYVTLEPCPMCAGAILQARIDTLVWGAPNKLLGADGSWIRLFPSGEEGGNGTELTDKPAAPVHPFHPNMKIRRGILASECAEVMQQFFQLRRRKKEKKQDPSQQPSCLPIANPQSKILNKMHDFFHVFCL